MHVFVINNIEICGGQSLNRHTQDTIDVHDVPPPVQWNIWETTEIIFKLQYTRPNAAQK